MSTPGVPDRQPSSGEPRGATSAPEEHADGSHGHSVAAWSAVGVIIAGCLIAGFGVVIATPWLFWVGVVVIVVGAVLGKVLSAMGFGNAGRDRDRASEGVR